MCALPALLTIIGTLLCDVVVSVGYITKLLHGHLLGCLFSSHVSERPLFGRIGLVC